MKLLLGTLFAVIIAGAFSQTIYSNADLRSGSSPGGTSCGHSDSYDFTGNSRGSFYVGFPTAVLSAPVSSALFYYKPTRCVNTDKLQFSVRTLKDATATFNEVGGINNQCPFLETKDTFEAVFDSSCTSQGIDVTSALNAALAANNNQFVLSLFDATKNNPNAENPNFCNRFSTPGVEPHFNDNSNCGVSVQSRQSFYLVVGSSTTAAPTTAAPSTAAPTTSAPTTAAPTSNSCAGANVSGPNVASPGRSVSVCSGNGYCVGQSCKCIPGYEGVECETQSPSKTCSSANVSGPNVASPGRSANQAQACNGNGACSNGKCACDAGFIGADCEVPVSTSCSSSNVSGPNVASPGRNAAQASVCNGNGYCLGQVCVCNAGFSGYDCQSTSTTSAPSTAAPSTTTTAPTQNISGDNNARVTSDTVKVVTAAGAILASAAALAL